MTTYQSQTCYTVDRDENSLAFSTINEPGEDAVLKAVVQVELPDGQQMSVNVLYEGDDVRNLQAYLADNFSSRARTPARTPARRTGLEIPDLEHATRLDGTTMPAPRVVPDENCWCGGQVGARTPGDHLGLGCLANIMHDWTAAGPVPQDLDYYPQDTILPPLPGPGDHVVVLGSDQQPIWEGTVPDPAARQCAVIYDGVQCTFVEHNQDMGHSFQAPNPQNDAGAATPPADAQGARNTPQSVPADEPAAESATGAGAPEVPASQPAEPKKRSRRTKLEMAYDNTLKDYNENPTVEKNQAFQAAAAALQAKEPGNSRFNQSTELQQVPEGQPTAAPGPAVGFAPETPQPWTQASGGASAFNPIAAEQAAQQFGQWAPAQPVQVSPEEGAAAQAFPCPVQSPDGRPCQRPYGHELMTDANPTPKPHVYATTDPQTLGQPVYTPGGSPAGTYATMPVGQPVQEHSHFSGPAPTGPLSFQVPPTPDQAAPHPETNLQPPAPAAPVWQQPQGGQ